MNKITTEFVEQQQLDQFADAMIDGTLQLNDDFLDRYCSDDVERELKRLDDVDDRASVLQGNLNDGSFPGTIFGIDEKSIALPQDEIAHQFEGKASDVFANVDDWTIKGDLAYLYTGYGALFIVDLDKVRQEIDDMLE